MNFVFKGGTCLKMAYGSPRYSEDLDFNSDVNKKAISQNIHCDKWRFFNGI